jgi:hypothetical protein
LPRSRLAAGAGHAVGIEAAQARAKLDVVKRDQCEFPISPM